MNFTSFGTIPSVHQLTPTTVASTVQTVEGSSNRFHNSTVNITQFSQPSAITTISVPSKFRSDDTNSQNKYNHVSNVQQQYSSISYSQQSEDKRLIPNVISYPPQTTIVSTTSPPLGQTQSQQQEVSQDFCSAILQQQSIDTKRALQNTSWQALNPNSAVADYLSHLPAGTLPLSLHHFLKYSAENIKKEAQNVVQAGQVLGLSSLGPCVTVSQHQNHNTQHLQQNNQQQQEQEQTTCTGSSQTNTSVTNAICAVTTVTSTILKKKKRKKMFKEKKIKPKPGEIRITTALDGSPLYCCPECQMAYPETGLLEVHLIGHNLERRFICDICNAALKRKDHLTRHKQSHNPERPYICSICLKAFKRKEQLSLHFVIHSGEKRHICNECGKGFYRKDHLRKHNRSHIARRVKAELSLQVHNGPSVLQLQVPLQSTENQQQSHLQVQEQQNQHVQNHIHHHQQERPQHPQQQQIQIVS